MKPFRKTLLLFVLTVIFCCTAVFAGAKDDIVVRLRIGDPMMSVNGKSQEIDAGRGTKPVVRNDRTLVPIRAIIEAFDGTVSWEAKTDTAVLTLGGDTVRLTIGSRTASCNGVKTTLDVTPTTINDRTMLPIRYVAESFNLGVAWDEKTESVYVLQNGFDESEYRRVKSAAGTYSGKSYTVLNGNKPYFKDYELITGAFEYYSTLDDLGRCDVCFAGVTPALMPTEKRGDISSVKPTGWINRSYDCVSGGSLYNRCHLIGFQLTGENANKRNLITGTRYLNVDGMLPFENRVADYVKSTGKEVLYRVTPVFSGSNLLADGVLMEAYSVADQGKGISLCVFCYNVQPNITLDYATGENYQSGMPSAVIPVAPVVPTTPAVTGAVYRTPTGKKYHLSATCGGKNSYRITLEQAVSQGLTPCAKCAK